MRGIIGIVIVFMLQVGYSAKANMSSPIWKGTISGSPFSSKDIDILSEKIVIIIDSQFAKAKFIVEYNIESDKEIVRIPLLFYAKDYDGSFSVRLDNQKVIIRDVPYDKFEGTPFSGFLNAVTKNFSGEFVYFSTTLNGSSYTRLNDLKYFEASITKGVHVIKVEYIATVWNDVSEWLTEYSFRYSLSPAKYWKSFGTLDITIQQEGEKREINTNLGIPDEKEIKQTNSWHFNHLPADILLVSYTPDTNYLAKFFIFISPVGLFIIILLTLSVIHYYKIIRYRAVHPKKKYSGVVIIGSIFVPLIAIISFIFSFDLIDFLIGENAGRHHGYVFVVILYYPILFIFYGLCFWLIDRHFKRKLTR